MNENETVKTAKQDQFNIPILTRRVVEDRDGGSCRVCGSFNKLEIHHIVRRGLGRNNDLCNLILLCSICHDFVEAGKLPHWAAMDEKDLFHISPVKAYMHTYDYSKIFCQTHKKELSLKENQPPIRNYAYKNHEPVFK